MHIKKDAPAREAVISLEAGEQLQEHLLTLAVQNVTDDPLGYWNIFVELPLEQAAEIGNRVVIERNGFSRSGSLTSADNKTTIRWKKLIRPSDDGQPSSNWFPSQPPIDISETLTRLRIERDRHAAGQGC